MAKHLAPKQSNRIVKTIKSVHTDLLMLNMIAKDNKGDIRRTLKLHRRLKSLRK